MENFNKLTIDTNVLDSLNDKILNDTDKKEKENKKRIESCKKVGSDRKRNGHLFELEFKKKYNETDQKVEYKAKADATISPTHPILSILKDKLGLNIDQNIGVSLKSGNNIQFTLGNIPELSCEEGFEWVCNKDNCKKLFEKYLKKSNSDSSCSLLVYRDDVKSNWIFFNMDEVIEYLTSGKWRKLYSGRLKMDFKCGDKYTQIITYEWRKTHGNSKFLGANGNKGKKLIELLLKNIRHIRDSII